MRVDGDPLHTGKGLEGPSVHQHPLRAAREKDGVVMDRRCHEAVTGLVNCFVYVKYFCRWRCCLKSITTINIMRRVFVFFHKHVRGIAFSSNMFDLDKGFLYIFANCIFANLNIAEAFDRHIVGPLDGGIIIVDSDGTVGDFMEDAEIEENTGNVLELFGALVD